MRTSVARELVETKGPGRVRWSDGVASTTVKIAGLLVRCAYSPVERADGIIVAPSNLGNVARSMSQGTLFRRKNAHHSAARDAAPNIALNR